MRKDLVRGGLSWVAHHGNHKGTQEGRGASGKGVPGTGRWQGDKEGSGGGDGLESRVCSESPGGRGSLSGARRQMQLGGQPEWDGVLSEAWQDICWVDCSPRAHPALTSACALRWHSPLPGHRCVCLPCTSFPGWALLLMDRTSSLVSLAFI